MNDGENEEMHNNPTEYYPFTLTDESGVKYEIVDTLCFKFFNMDVSVNGPGAIIVEDGWSEQNLISECRIRVLKTNKAIYVVALDDNIYHTTPLVVPCKNSNYIYVRFADAVTYARMLGYKDIINRSKFDKALETNTRLKKLKYKEYWNREKKKRVRT